MRPNDRIAAGYVETPVASRDNKVAAGYKPTPMTDAIEALAERDPDKLTPQMRIQLGYIQSAREAAARVERGEGQ